jgi:hypothetical protein
MLDLAERLKYKVPNEFKYIWEPRNKKAVPIL